MVQSLKQFVSDADTLIVMRDAEWDDYSRVLKMLGDSNKVRITFDRGKLQIMSPGLVHDEGSRCFAYFVQILAEEWGIPFRAAGSVTMRRKAKQAGLEADESFWLANSPKMAGKKRLDLRRDPPPDLTIEMEIRRSPINRMNVYARLGVPEVWRNRNSAIMFYRLAGKKYETAATSQSFPGLTPTFIQQHFAKAKAADDWTDVLRKFRAAARKLRPKSH